MGSPFHNSTPWESFAPFSHADDRMPANVVQAMSTTVHSALSYWKQITQSELGKARDAFLGGKLFEVLNLLRFGDSISNNIPIQQLATEEQDAVHSLLWLSCYKLIFDKNTKDKKRLARAVVLHLGQLTIKTDEVKKMIQECELIIYSNWETLIH